MGRPLASGWLGLAAGGRADTTIVLLDCSPSMQQQGDAAPISKLDAGRRRLAETLATLGSSRWVLIERALPRRLASWTRRKTSRSSPCTGPTSAEADLPAMLEAARDYIKANRAGRTEISDLLRTSARTIGMPTAGRGTPSAAVSSNCRRGSASISWRILKRARQPGRARDRCPPATVGQQAELLVSLLLLREGNKNDKATVPVGFEIDGARTEVNVEMTGPQYG